LAAEGLKEQLYAALVARVDSGRGYEKILINEITKYEDSLRPQYDSELLDLYENLISKISEFAGGRSHYQEIVRFLRRMLSYPEGSSRVSKLLEKWRFTYSNRPAMQEELQVLYREK
jgi:hypothetical protein